MVIVALTLPVSEIFGPVWQGEGAHAGRCCSFLRLGLCNLSCDWCDTPYTWDNTRYDVKAECPPMDAESILARLAGHCTTHLVLTGGEPLMHAHSPVLREVLTGWSGTVDLETNGTLLPPPWVGRLSVINVSPKINTGDPESKRLKFDRLRAWAALDNAHMKVVCITPEDVYTTAALADALCWPVERVWVMPEGTTSNGVIERSRGLAEHVARRGLNLTLRSHTIMYGPERER